MREVKLPSGAVLKIQVSSFAVSKALYQALLKEIRTIPVSKDMNYPDIYKELFCTGFASPVIEACLWECFKRCTYDGDAKIDEHTFEAEASRQDYMSVCIEVAKDNIAPFVKSLFAGYQQFIAMTANIPT